MGMRINGGGGGYAAGAQDAQWQQRRQNFDALAQAISGGNLAGANDALAKIQGQTSSADAAKPNSFLDQIGAALKSGDIASAQQILAARFNQRNGDQQADADASQQAGAVTAANAATAASATSATGASSGSHGRHHHHHGGGGSSPALDLSQAIQSGDAAKAQSSMQTILTDLQQVAAMGSLATTGASGNTAASQAITAASNLLQNPDFQALEAAIANGDSSGMKSAWAKLIGAPANADSTAAAATTDSTAAATTVTPTVA